DPVVSGQFLLHRGANIGIGVDRIQHSQMWELTAQIEDSIANLGERSSEILSSVGSQQNVVTEAACGMVLVFCRREMQRVDHCVGGEVSVVLRSVLREHILERALRGTKMQAREAGDRDAVVFLGERIIEVERTQSRFDVSKGNATVEA